MSELKTVAWMHDGKTRVDIAHEKVKDLWMHARPSQMTHYTIPLVLLSDAQAEIDKRQAFKDYVHQRLDSMGVPHSIPESEHDKAGCRVGGRLDWLESKLAEIDRLEESLRAERAVSERLLEALTKLLDKNLTYIGGRATFSYAKIQRARRSLAEVEAMRAQEVR